MKASKLEEFQHNTELNEASLSVKEAPDQSIRRPEKVRAEAKDFLNFFFFFPFASCRKHTDVLPSNKTRSDIFLTPFHPAECPNINLLPGP